MAEDYRMYVDEKWQDGKSKRVIRSPYSGEIVSNVPDADADDVEAAVISAVSAFDDMRKVPCCTRAELLLALKDGILNRSEDFAKSIASEAGKPVGEAMAEVERAGIVLELSAEEARRIGGELIPLDLQKANAGRFGITRRFPLGPVLGITPFNFPLNLGMHKVGPALAAGNSIIWKPASQTPGAAFLFAEVFYEACRKLDIPKGALNVLSVSSKLAEKLVSDDRLKFLTFTGSAEVGWSLKSKSGRKKVTLELGGNAGVIIGADADLDYAVKRCVKGGFSFAGQVCISVQRIFIEEKIYNEFITRLVAEVEKLKVGDPLYKSTDVGPVITEGDAARITGWISQAVEDGAMVLTGGKRKGTLVEPTVVAGVKPDMKICCKEIFGPVVTVKPFGRWEDAIAEVNDSEFGLQAGIFTRDLVRAFKAFDTIEVGGLIVNDVPTFRSDNMPYGGVKSSGMGREGVKYAVEEMTEPRLMAFNLL